ncbi:caltractin-like [Haliotis rufescens]|uniref:caltractin-like n=1 Tax=Haliotis rufescens TaxID=6454 RepID=UPI00201F37E5|nr:caltractin-like [Haliotis rufescens]
MPVVAGMMLIKLLTSHPVDEKEIHGIKVSSRVLEQLTSQEVRDLRVVFEIFDASSTGFIGPLELKKAMRVLRFKISRDEARRMIMDVSLKGRAKIDFNEFLETVIDRQGDNRDVYEEILKGFNMFDTDGSGAISQDNLRQACRDVGIKFTQKELQEMIEEADVNGDGVIDKEEFTRIMLQTNLF